MSTVNTVVMPAALTAEIGAKALMMGEYFETSTDVCQSCLGEEDNCNDCNDTGEVEVRVAVSWATIKKIYADAVKHFGIPFETQSEGE